MKPQFNITTHSQEPLKLKRRTISGVGKNAEQPEGSAAVCESAHWHIRFEKLFGSIC